MSSIEWTDETWNPVIGCTKVSAGCKNCYAMRMAHRLASIGTTAAAYEGLTEVRGSGPQWTGRAKCFPERLKQPFPWRKPRRVFVCSMGDLFHRDVPSRFLSAAFAVMAAKPRHTFQVLTKRTARALAFFTDLEAQADMASCNFPHDPPLQWRIANHLQAQALKLGVHAVGAESMPASWPLQNVWLGVSVENVDQTHRIDTLRLLPAAVRFVSIEPLLGPLPALDLTGIDWVIVGSESGPGRRLARMEWVREIRDQCIEQHVAFFFKQWHDERGRKFSMPALDGQQWAQYPEVKR